jgi:hypothetical protein
MMTCSDNSRLIDRNKDAYDDNRIHSKRKRNNRLSKIDHESEYHKFLSQQLFEKHNKLKSEKEADKRFVIIEKEKIQKEDQERQKFFDRLKNFQAANEAKNKMLEKFMSQDEAQLSSKKDEQSYLLNIAAEEERAKEKAVLESQKQVQK